MALPGFVAMLGGEVAGLATYNLEGDACELVMLDSLMEGQGRWYGADRGCGGCCEGSGSATALADYDQ
jgi:hypothetical protein